MGIAATDGRDDAFTDAGDNRGLAGAADITVDGSAHRDAGFDVELNAVFRDALKYGRFDDLGIDRHLHRFLRVPAGKVHSAGTLPLQWNLCALRRDECQRDVVYMAAG